VNFNLIIIFLIVIFTAKYLYFYSSMVFRYTLYLCLNVKSSEVVFG